MLILKRSHFVFVLFFIFLSFSFYLVSQDLKNRNYQAVQVSALPINQKVIIVDAGHGRRRWSEQ